MNRVLNYIFNSLVKPISKWITGKRYRIRFQEKEERDYQKILDFLDQRPDFLKEISGITEITGGSHKHTKLVTVNHRADNPLDPLRYPLPYTEKESRMDQGAPPRDRRKPSQ